MKSIEIKVEQVWRDTDQRPDNRHLRIQVTLLVNLDLCCRKPLKPRRKNTILAMTPEMMEEVKEQVRIQTSGPALFTGQHSSTAEPNCARQSASGMKSRRFKGQGGRGGNIVAVNEIESLVDGGRWKDLNSCTNELSTYMFGGGSGFTSGL